VNQVLEHVQVSVDQAGQPVRFTWRGGNYLVSEKPVRWFSRRDWWLEASRVPKGIGAGVFEVEIWRILAAETKARHCLQFEFAHDLDPASGRWQLIQVID
jgi:hypothetical protein